MTKKELIKQVAAKTGLTQKDVQTVYSSLVSTIQEHLSECGEVRIPHFGRFYVTTLGERKIIHPASRETLHLPPSKAVRFRGYDSLRTLINVEKPAMALEDNLIEG